MAAKLRENVELLHKLQTLQDELLPIARRGSLIYTVLKSLSAINPHYQFKLPQFLQMFFEAVGEDPPPDVFLPDDDENLVCLNHLYLPIYITVTLFLLSDVFNLVLPNILSQLNATLQN